MSGSAPIASDNIRQEIPGRDQWEARHNELTSWAMKRLVNRTDRFGCYRDHGPFTASNLTEANLETHFSGGILVGLHSTSDDGTCRWLALDIDNHDGDAATAVSNFESAMEICNKLTAIKVCWLLEDSNGDGGFHIWILFSNPAPVEAVHRFGMWLVSDDAHEVFPKQPELTGKGLGNWLRLPGRHHTRDHWSRFWGGTDWLDDEESVDLLLNAPTNDPLCLKHAPKEPEPAREGDLTGITSDLAPPVNDRRTKNIIELAEDFIAQKSWSDILTAEGWKLDSEHDGQSNWIRPGKNNGTSATLNYSGNGKIHIFSTGTDLPDGKSYGKFRFWAYSHGFDDSRQVDAAKALLPDDVVAENDRQWGESGNPVDESCANPSSNEAIVDKSKQVKIARDEFEPFPVDLLPDVLRRFVTESAAAIGCDPVMALMPALGVCAAAIGTSRNLLVKYSWFVPSVLWPVVIGESGSQKSPPFRLAVDPLKTRQSRDAKQYAAELRQYQTDMREYKKTFKQWEKDASGEEPSQPAVPSRPRCIAADTTIEALAKVLDENPRGILLARDELSAWISGFDKYSKGGASSSEVPRWLEIYNTDSITVDRKTGDTPFIFVKRPSVCIAGGIQPDILRRCMTDEHRANGLQSRLLMVYPPRQPKRWRDEEVSDATLAAYRKAIDELFTLQGEADADGDPAPCLLKLTRDAREIYKQFVDSHGAEQNAMYGHLASQWSKLEEIPPRLALVLHCLKQVTTGVVDHFEVDDRTMTAAVAMTEWFKSECLRINRLLAEPDETREVRHLIEWIHRQGGRFTARDLCRKRRDIESTEDAEKRLIYLVSIGAGSWEEIHKSRIFVLNSRVSTIDA